MSLVIVYFSVILSYAVVIHWNAKIYNNGLNINRNMGVEYNQFGEKCESRKANQREEICMGWDNKF